jgi:hypothetical protein
MPRADTLRASFTVIVPITSPQERKQHQCIRSPPSTYQHDDECVRKSVLPGSDLQKDACHVNDNNKEIDAVDENPSTVNHDGEDNVDDGAQQMDKGQAHERQEMVCQASATASTSQESEMMHSVTRVETTVDMEEFDSLEAPHVEVCISLVQRTTRLVYIHLLAY